MISFSYMTSFKFISLDYITLGASKVGVAAFLYKTTFGQKQCSPCFFSFSQPCLIDNFKRMTWFVKSSIDDSSFSSPTSNGSDGRTRMIRVIQEFQINIGSKLQEVKKNLPAKVLFFLVGFYCATAFATVIGQTGDWDILSAGLAVVIVEGIGALMYRTSLPFVSKSKSLISFFNYWKVGLKLGLFLDSFKY
ncbi:PREDICTED: ycf20-like protein [Lupinus angustifolius]|uniref:ycf20-like protein n=1 Tax=Lupinus angustifolius TaxID=3871 RepID=UPI00092F7C71|nr:PREDICTED: ycf20-like protein [Lupinus angustifolius]